MTTRRSMTWLTYATGAVFLFVVVSRYQSGMVAAPPVWLNWLLAGLAVLGLFDFGVAFVGGRSEGREAKNAAAALYWAGALAVGMAFLGLFKLM